MKKVLRYLFLGILSIIPLLIVIQVVYWVQEFSVELFKVLTQITDSTYRTTIVIVISIIILIFFGYSTEKFGKSYFLSIVEKILDKIPAIRTIYSVSKKVTDIFTQNNGNSKKEVVLVEYPKDNIWVPAYVLNKHDGVLVLFIPTSPNPTSGYTVLIEENRVEKTTLSIEEASKFIISMGADFVKKEEISKKIKESKS